MGKTGTAQVVAFKERAETKEQLMEVPYKHRDHAWFVAVTEDTEKKLVILAFCEHGGHASESAVPVVREIAKKIAGIVPMSSPPKEESG
jgi:penicillin-binding protein 2